MKKCALDIIKEMTQRIIECNNRYNITEKHYTYSKDEIDTIYKNIYGSIEEYTTKNTDENAYENLLNSLSDRFKTSQLGGDISRQVDNMSSADELFENQTSFQEMLDNAKDVAEFIREKTEKLNSDGVVVTKEEPTKIPDEDINKQ